MVDVDELRVVTVGGTTSGSFLARQRTAIGQPALSQSGSENFTEKPGPDAGPDCLTCTEFARQQLETNKAETFL